jgi:DNA-binding NtrC family response regulator
MSDRFATTKELSSHLAAVASNRIRLLSLVHTPAEEALPRRAVLDGRTLVIGRDPGADGFPLDDGETSRRHAELTYADEVDRYRIRDLESRNGSLLNGRRVGAEYLAPGDVIRLGGSIFVYGEAQLPAGRPAPAPSLLGEASLLRVIAESAADLAALSKLPILIQGPTGSGKEVLAHRIHDKSGRKGPMIAVNCSTFSRELIGSELFGHTQGAFSGARTARSGLFVSAAGGTLFLDEIAELPLDQQPALLRALQEGKVRPVGSDAEVAVDVRVLAATHQPLDALASAGTFRSDLYARLAGFVVALPGLVERRDEILSLFLSFVGAPKRRISTAAAEALLLHPWPHNVRELRHAAEHAKLFASEGEIEIGHLPPQLLRSVPQSADADPDGEDPQDAPSKEELLRLLDEHQGNVAQIARLKHRHRAQVYRWLKRHGIDAGRFRDESSD